MACTALNIYKNGISRLVKREATASKKRRQL